VAEAAVTRLGVVGWPVAHSRSPAMHNAALREVGLSDWRYQRLPVPPELFVDAVGRLAERGFRGVNVTIPHKEAALAVADIATSRATAIGAANTLLFDPDGTVHADNTDAPALIEALNRHGVVVPGGTALVVGAGGSARAAVWALLDAGAGEVRVLNRTRARAEALCRDLGGTVVDSPEPANVLVHCTPVGLRPSAYLSESDAIPIPVDRISTYRTVVDFVYREQGSALARAARSLAVEVVDGLELLVGQGALSFEQFTGGPAPRRTMSEAAGSPWPR
jgi:shikimate dehydrogenase